MIVIFYFKQIPLARDGQELDYSRWQQSLIGTLYADILYDDEGPAGVIRNLNILYLTQI